METEKLLYTGDACTGDVVLFEQNVYEMLAVLFYFVLSQRMINGRDLTCYVL